MSKMAIMGYGVVGSGVYDVMRKNAASIAAKTGTEIDIGYILDIRDFPQHPEKNLFTKDFGDILADKDIDIVAEVIGGITPAYDFTKKCLLAGKSVVTSNKELVAEHGTELLKIADDNGCCYLFEASVGGGIPIIDPLNRCMAANEISEIYGILNGTTNYILTQMTESGKDFSVALAGAQQNGYAEANPAADVEGLDARRKIAILSAVAWGREIDCSRIETRGITDISTADIKLAQSLGFAVKLIGKSKNENGRITAFVAPMLVPRGNILYSVNDVFNAVVVNGNATGEVAFYGKGAGKDATASAVVADVISIASGCAKIAPPHWENGETSHMTDVSQSSFEYYVRINAEDKQAAENEFGALEFAADGDELAFITKSIRESEFSQKISNLRRVKQTLRTLR